MIKHFFQSLLISSLLVMPFSVFAVGDPMVTVIDEKESFPSNFASISEQVFTGNDPADDCSYFELLEKAKSTARSLGANVVRINKRIARNQKVFCDQLQVSFFKVEDVRAIEQRFSWTADRKLEWEDFKGPVPGNAAPRTAAETSCGIALETNTVNSRNPVKIYVFNTFVTGKSWVRPGHNNAAVLKHEQGHFDICELYTRKMRERFSQARIDVKNMQSVIRDIYNRTMNEYAERQQAYEQDTEHGVVEDAQQKWSATLATELANTEAWMSK